MGIGETLKKAREERGLTLEEVAEKTKIRHRYLEAIEKENFEIMPGNVYVKGFIRNYARFLGLRPEPLVALFTERHAQEQPVPETIQVQEERNSRLRRKSLAFVFVAAVLFLLAFGGIYAFMQQSAPPQQAQDDFAAPFDFGLQNDSGQNLSPPDQSAEPRVSPPPQKAPAQKGVSLVLNVVQDSCWMRVVVDGETKFTGELTANQSRSFHAKERIELKLGNAGAVQVQVNGRDLGYLGSKGEVIKREFIAVDEG